MRPFGARSFGVPQDDNTRPRFAHALVLAAILLLAAALRFHDIARHSFWPDELFTLQTSSGHGLQHTRLTNAGLFTDPPDLLSLEHANSWSSVVTTLARDDNHPPLYFLLMRAWRMIFGDSPAAVRALSAVFSIIAVALMYDVARRLHGQTAAVWAALIMAVAGPQIQFAQEARSYMLLVTLGLAALDALVRIEEDGPSNWRLIALGASVLGTMLSHYFAIAPCAAIGAYTLIRLRGRTRLRTFAALLMAAGLYLVLWGPFAWRQRANIATNNWWVIDIYPHHTWRTFFSAALLPMRFLTEPLRRAETAASIAAILYIAPPLFLLNRNPQHRRRDLFIWWLWLISTVAMVVTMDLVQGTRQTDFLRYTIVASPAIYAMLASVLSGLKPRWVAHAIPAAAVLTCLYGLPRAYAEPQTPKPDWRIPAALIAKEAKPTDIVLFFGSSPQDRGYTGFHYLALKYYAGDKLPRTLLFIARRPTDEEMARLRAATGVWLLLPTDTTLPDNFLPGFRPGPEAHVWGLPGVQLWIPPSPTTLPRSRN